MLKFLLATQVQCFALVFGICHEFLCFYYPYPPPSDLFDAHSIAHINKILFTPTPTSIICCTFMIIGADERRLAMLQLGNGFVWEITTPPKLCQGGIYRHIQHLSYPFRLTSFVAAHCLLVRTDGVAACLGSDVGGWIILVCWAEFALSRWLCQGGYLRRRKCYMRVLDRNGKIGNGGLRVSYQGCSE